MRLQNKNVADIEDKFRHHFKCGFVILEEKLPLCKAAYIMRGRNLPVETSTINFKTWVVAWGAKIGN